MTELMVIFVIGLVVLGPKRLPSLARSLGKSMAEFRRASTALRSDFMNVADDLRPDPLDAPEPRAKSDTPEEAAARDAAKATVAKVGSEAATAGETKASAPSEPGDATDDETESAADRTGPGPTPDSTGG